MTSTFSNTRDAAVFSVLIGRFSEPDAQRWLARWQEIRSSRTSVYDAIVSFVNLIEAEEAAQPSAWLRVLLIDAVTQAEQEQLLVA